MTNMSIFIMIDKTSITYKCSPTMLIILLSSQKTFDPNGCSIISYYLNIVAIYYYLSYYYNVIYYTSYIVNNIYIYIYIFVYILVVHSSFCIIQTF
jgi:hypothetical protein